MLTALVTFIGDMPLKGKILFHMILHLHSRCPYGRSFPGSSFRNRPGNAEGNYIPGLSAAPQAAGASAAPQAAGASAGLSAAPQAAGASAAPQAAGASAGLSAAPQAEPQAEAAIVISFQPIRLESAIIIPPFCHSKAVLPLYFLL
jgi:hypothetical protein